MTENPHEQSRDLDQEGPGDLPYKDDTSDGTTAKTPQEIAEETAGQVKSSDDLIRDAEGRDAPPEGHDVRDYDRTPQPAENAGDDEAVDENGDDVDTPDDTGAR